MQIPHVVEQVGVEPGSISLNSDERSQRLGWEGVVVNRM